MGYFDPDGLGPHERREVIACALLLTLEDLLRALRTEDALHPLMPETLTYCLRLEELAAQYNRT